jgi:hypothetical protein
MYVLCLVLVGLLTVGTVRLAYNASIRTDNGQPLHVDNALPLPPKTDTTKVSLQEISWCFTELWVAFPHVVPKDSPLSATIIHPVVIVNLDANGLVCLSLTTDANWTQHSVGDFVPEDTNGVPLDWNYSTYDVAADQADKLPITIQSSIDLLDWEDLATVYVSTNSSVQYVDVSDDMSEPLKYYRGYHW